MRIAIVGSGVSGLVAAHLLHRHHEITVFEATGRVGGHVNTVDVSMDGGTWAIDTGFIVYNERNYPNFSRLLTQLDVPTQPSSMSWSVRADHADLEYNGSTLPLLFAQRRNLVRPRFYRMLGDIIRFNRDAPGAIRNGSAHHTLGEYLAERTYADAFVNYYPPPMGSAIWSVPRSRVLDMPAAFFVRFFENHGMLTVDDRPTWRVVQGGSARYVEVLTTPFADRIRLRHPVRRIMRHAGHVEVDGEPFDHVVIACHADQAVALLADPSNAEREILDALPYEPNEAVLHSDTSLLPRRRRAWAAWNYRVGEDPAAPATLTYNMNALQTLTAPRTWCVTLNDTDDIDPAHIIARIPYEHPIYSRAGTAAQGRHAEISGVNRTHYCGAYWANGFHEDGVRSALAACAPFGVSL
jgi:predicted NAD/FAD-binding protein